MQIAFIDVKSIFQEVIFLLFAHFLLSAQQELFPDSPARTLANPPPRIKTHSLRETRYNSFLFIPPTESNVSQVSTRARVQCQWHFVIDTSCAHCFLARVLCDPTSIVRCNLMQD